MSCICKILRNLMAGDNIILTSGGQPVSFQFLRTEVDCVRGSTLNGAMVLVDCKNVEVIEVLPPDPCTINIFVQAEIVCDDIITGQVRCDGTPVAGIPVTITADPPLLTFTPNPVLTDASGNFSVAVTVPANLPETAVAIHATATTGIGTVFTTATTVAECPPGPCRIDMFMSESTIVCEGFLMGRVICGSQTIEGAVVTLTSSDPRVSFNQNTTTTDSAGDFTAGVRVAPGTPAGTIVTITATTIVNGQVLSTTSTITVDCPDPCSIVLTVPPVICEGTISGNLSCDGTPQAGVTVTFETFPDVGAAIPSATTDANGNFTTTITIPPGTELTSVDVIASAVAGVPPTLYTVSQGTQVSCPGVITNCPCKLRLGVAGNGATAAVDITNQGAAATLVGTINVTAVECFTGGPNCNPNVDNFNITFGSGGTTINFVQGRRIRITCIDRTSAIIEGTAEAAGNTFRGVFDIIIGISLTANQATWSILADNNMGQTFSTTFTSRVSPQTFIGPCNSTVGG
ncbi:hypothetical protein [Fictibacillus fluitans]|uniref:Big-1 domain-containing protein n=1 Tax=Fictibacillus fluitans TaxID=3058422 RepID=A0ABT8HQM3_9BACL|nr:hypothetical protein [Fictibacillus sp. NE201]MDN4523063.1 hypothetical protein [Fictibacillus sp. NE201]